MIRPATVEDIDSIKILIDEAAKRGKLLKRSEAELKHVIGGFFVYEEKGAVIGCCSLEVYSKKLAEVRSLVVDDAHQNKGIGRKLVNACIKKAQKLDIYELLSITDKDIFFEKMGFQKCLHGQWAVFMRP